MSELEVARFLISYGERRVTMFGDIDDRLHVAVIMYRGDEMRVISLRRANKREERKHAKTRVALTPKTRN